MSEQTNRSANVETVRPQFNSANGGNLFLTGEDLVNTAATEIPFLWDYFFPQVGLVAMTGPSESGKSSLLRHLSIAICNGASNFLGSSLKLRHKKVLNVITEDSQISVSVNLKKQTQGAFENIKNMKFLFNSSNVLADITAILATEKFDLIIIDVWGDTIDFSTNEMFRVRGNLKEYARLANEYEACICIIHHNVKRSEEKEPSKNNVNGSQAIEAITRSMVELRVVSDIERQLSIVKSNYVLPGTKKKKWILKTNENLQYELSRVLECGASVQGRVTKSDNEEVVATAIELYKTEKHSQEEVVQILKEQFNEKAPSKGTLNKWLRKQNNP